MFAATQTDALVTRFSRTTTAGALLWRSEYFGPAPSPSGAKLIPDAHLEYVDPQPGEERQPQAFLVEQEPGAVVPAHFHYVDQFQVVVAGGGSLGAHKVAPLSVHFAGAVTGYGPIVPGPAGLSYFTLRASADITGAHYLPQSRSRMRPGVRRNVIVDRIHTGSAQDVAARTTSVVECALEERDGLAAYILRLRPSDLMQLPDASAGGGATILVTGGEVACLGRRYAAFSCLFASRCDDRLTVTAGEQGAELLFLRYPGQPASA